MDPSPRPRSNHRSGKSSLCPASTPPEQLDYLALCSRNSKDQQYLILLLLLPLGLIFLSACLVAIIWLALHGPMLVPNQDTRLASIAISASSKAATLIMGVAFVRSAWASAVVDILDGRPMTTKRLLATCRPFLSLGQFQNFNALPLSFKMHVILGAFSVAAIVATSSSFRYDSLPTNGNMIALVPDVSFACPAQLVNDTGLFICDQGGQKLNILTNTSIHSWDYLQEVNSGGQRTVTKYGAIGDASLGANVTIATLPAGWKLGDVSDLPWMAMWVLCKPRVISVSHSGTGYNANTSVFLDGAFAVVLDIGAMPQWNSVVHPILRVNDSGPFSSLGEYDVIMLARDLKPNMRGVDDDTVTDLGVAYLDLKGYGAIEQPLLGAAARCSFRAETGGRWQEGLWPSLNHTANIIWGEVVDDRPTLATAMLNYGASWQYTQVSDNDVPGGSVSYIANNTGPDVNFSALFASYVRNQWALMAYAISRHTYFTLEQPFHGTGPNRLFISVTLVAVVPGTALLLAMLVTARACMYTVLERYWVNRVEFESWWLMKASRPDLYPTGFGNAAEDRFIDACGGVEVEYRDVKMSSGVGQLMLQQAGNEEDGSGPIKKSRIYG
ncbi:hypothetical protein DL764_003194 [Monosporascus ibericus]|uniref:Uncharacterized protein n=1 Tax=Monosporascus ibericus TaxID=155417 RepID=A0A4Q4TJ98_9PEZI|nr:hypothetical protein DL764_003194 [Monosporascus ibericus]